MKEKARCPHCGRRMEGRWEVLSKGLVWTLVKFKQAVIYAGKNDIRPDAMIPLFAGDLETYHKAMANFQKLRFHALVAKVREGGDPVAGRWLLTRRGSQFLLGNVSIPKRVFVYDNEVKEHDAEEVFVSDVIKTSPVWDGKFEFEYAAVAGAEKQGDFFK